MNVDACAYIYIHTRIYVATLMYVCKCIYMWCACLCTHTLTHTHTRSYTHVHVHIYLHTPYIIYIPLRHLWPNESPFLAPNLARNLLHFWTSSHVRALSLSPQPAPQREKQGGQWGEEHTSAPWESQQHDNSKSHEKWKMCFKASKTMEVLKQGWNNHDQNKLEGCLICHSHSYSMLGFSPNNLTLFV